MSACSRPQGHIIIFNGEIKCLGCGSFIRGRMSIASGTSYHLLHEFKMAALHAEQTLQQTNTIATR